MCLNETYSRARVYKHLSDMFPVKNGLKQQDALTPLPFNFALEYTIRRVQASHDGFNPLNAKLNPICYLLALLAHHFLHVSRIRVKSLTLRLLMSYIYMVIYIRVYIYIYIYI